MLKYREIKDAMDLCKMQEQQKVLVDKFFFWHSTKDCGRGYNISVVIPLTFVWFCSTISVVSL